MLTLRLRPLLLYVWQVLLLLALATLVADAQTIVLQSGTTDLGTVTVGAGASSTQTLTYAFSGSVTMGAPVVVTQGAEGLDFTTSGTGTCAAGLWVDGTSCTVDVTFTP